MAEDSKILVVVAVLAVIFVGLFSYMLYLDRKIRNLEKQLPDHEHK